MSGAASSMLANRFTGGAASAKASASGSLGQGRSELQAVAVIIRAARLAACINFMGLPSLLWPGVRTPDFGGVKAGAFGAVRCSHARQTGLVPLP